MLQKFPKILLVNSYSESCGVYDFGHKVYRCLKDSDSFNIEHYRFNNDYDNLIQLIDQKEISHLILNKHVNTLGGFGPNFIDYLNKIFPALKIMIMPHDEIIQYNRSLIDHIFWIDPTIEKCGPNESILGRPIIEVGNLPTSSKRFTLGYSGWLFSHKRVELVAEFGKSLGIDIHYNIHFAPYPNYVDKAYEAAVFKAFDGLSVTFNHDLMTTDELTRYLAKNTINVFPYEDRGVINHGISSIIDYALASKRPFLLSNSNMFRHVSKLLPKYSIYNQSASNLLDILTDFPKDLEPYWSKWSPKSLQNTVFEAINV